MTAISCDEVCLFCVRLRGASARPAASCAPAPCTAFPFTAPLATCRATCYALIKVYMWLVRFLQPYNRVCWSRRLWMKARNRPATRQAQTHGAQGRLMPHNRAELNCCISRVSLRPLNLRIGLLLARTPSLEELPGPSFAFHSVPTSRTSGHAVDAPPCEPQIT